MTIGNGQSYITGDSIILQDVADLPQDWVGALKVYCDFETSSGAPDRDSLNPWANCSLALIAITVDECPQALAIPYMHFDPAEQEIIRDWLGAVLYNCDEWINQNVKYDAHVAANTLDLLPPCKLVCSLTQAKIKDSDRITRGGYGLDAICKDWLGEDLSPFYNSLQPYIKRNGKWFNRDYGQIPYDILGEYAAAQVLANRRLQKFLDETIPEQCRGVVLTEIQLTRNIFQMERNGLRVDRDELLLTQFQVLNRLCKIDDKLAEIVGFPFRPHVSGDLYDVLIVKYGLPVLAYTKDDDGNDTLNPSFDKHAMLMYEAQPTAPKDVLKLVREYKELFQLNALFLESWLECAVPQGFLDNKGAIIGLIHLLHSTYNQTVRTGRMSCSEPNAQQLSPRAKKLIHPKPGYAFIAADASQIEFRFITHYINDEKAIAAFNENPDTDFHVLVAQWCGIPRKPAKSVNFGIAFGEGKKKLIKQLASNKDLVASLGDIVKDLIAKGELSPELEVQYFNELATKRGEQVFNTYHSTFPTLKPTMRAAENALKSRGYVFNMYGRHRHLPLFAAYRAFNTVNQSSAADMLKERINALCRMIDGTPIELSACVHDSVLLQAPIEIANDWRTLRDTLLLLENPVVKLSIPIRWTIGVSAENWKAADDDERHKAIELSSRRQDMFTNLQHLR